MTEDVTYDGAANAKVIRGEARTEAPRSPELRGDSGLGRHSGSEMEAAARATGQSDILDQYVRDYPQGPHDKPQSRCPAFGSLRVGLRMKRVATVPSGSACCVYGLFPDSKSASVGMGSIVRGVDLKQATADLRAASGLTECKTLRREGAPIPLKPLDRWDNGKDVALAGDARQRPSLRWPRGGCAI